MIKDGKVVANGERTHTLERIYQCGSEFILYNNDWAYMSDDGDVDFPKFATGSPGKMTK